MDKLEIEEFFNQVKDDSFFDFQKKYEKIECCNRLFFTQYLISLEKKYKKENRINFRSEKNYVISEKLARKIRNSKRIISYLKKHKNMLLEENKDNENRKIIKNDKFKQDKSIYLNDQKSNLKIDKKIVKKKNNKKKIDIDNAILEFFEIEKNDSLYEFEVNYNNFNYENRTQLNRDLLKLYNNYLKKNLFEYHQNDGSEFKEQSKLMIKKIKAIIKFLSSDINELGNEDEKIIINKVKKTKKKSEEIKLYIDNNLLDSFDKDLSVYPINKAIDLFIEALKYRKIDKELFNQAKDLIYRCALEDNEDVNIINSLYSISDCIKQRKLRTSKDDKKTRKRLKDIYILFDYVKAKYKKEKSVNQEGLFYILEYFLNNETYFEYLKQLIEKMPGLVNIRYEDGLEKKHILNHILDLFLNNYEKMLNDKYSDYINTDYLKNVYMLFLKNKNLSISRNELKQIDLKLQNFVKETNKNLTSSKRKNVVKLDLRDMYTDKMYMDLKYEFFEYYDDYNYPFAKLTDPETKLIEYGVKDPEVCKNIQLSVAKALDIMTGLKVNAVNVAVQGVKFKEITTTATVSE